MTRINIFELKGAYRILSHLIFWIGAFFFILLLFGHQYGNYSYTLNFVGIMLAITAATSYVTIYYLIPRYLFEKKYFTFVLYSIYLVIISVYFEIIFSFLYVFKVHQFRAVLDPSVIDLFFLMVGTYFIVFIVAGIKLIKHWVNDQQKSQILAKEKVETELKLLKSQIHPHFLFNTLNNIYSLALERSEKTADVIVKLSEILDYLLYETKLEKVPLQKEVQLISNYLELEKLRYGGRLRLNTSFDEHLDSLGIAPLLMLPFVENAFKHGVSKKRNDVIINLSIKVKDAMLMFYIDNDKPEAGSEKNTGGIGLENVRKRLDISYPGKHSLVINESGTKYSVTLEVQLDII